MRKKREEEAREEERVQRERLKMEEEYRQEEQKKKAKVQEFQQANANIAQGKQNNRGKTERGVEDKPSQRKREDMFGNAPAIG